MSNRFISVIVPIYNVENYLKKCINSILSQTYEKLEIILIDDGSTDKSSSICDFYERLDSRIIVKHTSNRGQSTARNIGLRLATGDFIGFVDADDYLEQSYYENLVKGLDFESNVSVACENSVAKKKFEVINQEQAISRIMGGDLETVVWNKLFKKDVIQDVFFPEGQVHEEIEFNRKYLMNLDYIVVVKGNEYKYTLHRNGNTKSRFEDSRLNSYQQIISFLNELSDKKMKIAKRNVSLFGLIHFEEMYRIAHNTRQSKAVLDLIKKYYLVMFRKCIVNSVFLYHRKTFIKSLQFLVLECK